MSKLSVCAEICEGAGARLVDMVVSPHALVESSSRLRLHSIYYITKQVHNHHHQHCSPSTSSEVVLLAVVDNKMTQCLACYADHSSIGTHLQSGGR